MHSTLTIISPVRRGVSPALAAPDLIESSTAGLPARGLHSDVSLDAVMAAGDAVTRSLPSLAFFRSRPTGIRLEQPGRLRV